ncbi:FG-GAP-like repeat-containing protein [Alcanivorax sp. DP30]|uniref:FG-GAP-like repeat-containing protein n=1 Tax=Alcanivorax sp. DP30 TaxID=2606217 RepID=UPI001367EEA2|nr:FG-GAP-like repeat-containing protein [Alcanivorax sp. DP30]MZR63225.1 LPXTG cell wall anchor domain-containing protein [Alcanivorax sp. DP30]
MSLFSRQPLAAAVRASVLGGVAIIASPSYAGFTEVTENNPFDAITSGTVMPSLTLQDFDDDGDLEAVVFHASDEDVSPFDGHDISFYENTGSAQSAEFTQIPDSYAPGYGGGDTFEENPFASSWSYASYGHPVASGDLDGDGDADFIGGSNTSSVEMWFGVTTTDAYGEAASLADGYHNGTYYWSESPYYGQGLVPYLDAYGGYASAVPLDIDGDDDMDLVVMDNQFVRVYQNNGLIEGVVQLNELTGSTNPFYAGASNSVHMGIPGNIPAVNHSAHYGAPLAAGDVDNDGDMDVIMGVRNGPGDMLLFVNTGTAGMAVFEQQSDASLDVSTDIFAAPVMADIDNDNDDDLVVAEQQASGTASYRLFLNDGASAVADDNNTGNSSSSSGGAMGGLLAGLSLLLLRRRRR